MSNFRFFIALIATLITLAIGNTARAAWDLKKLSEKYRGQNLNISLMIGYEWNKVLVDELIPEFEKQTHCCPVHFIVAVAAEIQADSGLYEVVVREAV